MSEYPLLHSLFHPKSVAIVGASPSSEKMGYIVLENLLQAKFPGAIFPINPKGGTILGLPVFRKIDDISKSQLPIDLAIICLPVNLVLTVLDEIGRMGTKAVIIMSSGFKESGSIGAQYEEKVKKLTELYGFALLGPASMGIVNTHASLNAFAIPRAFHPGRIGFFSQSASMCDGMSDWAFRNTMGISSFIHLGNKALIDEAEIISAMADDPNTKVILGFLENVENGSRFLKYAQVATRKKPVILMKAARSNLGSRAVSAHTGAAAGSDMAYEAAFKQAGIIRAEKIEDLFILGEAFATQPLPKGPGVVVVTTASGPGIIATDACVAAGLTIPMLSPSTMSALQSLLPGYAPAYNPVDVGNDVSQALLSAVVQVVLKDPAVHTLLFVGTRTSLPALDGVAKNIAHTAVEQEKPVFVCLMGCAEAQEEKCFFRNAGVACYDFPETAVNAIAAMVRQSSWAKSPMPVEVGYRRDIGRAKKVIDAALKENITELGKYRGLDIVKAYEMPVLESKLARTSEEALQIAKQLGYPVALKVASPYITHKSDTGGVFLDIDTPEKLKKTFTEITAQAMHYRRNTYITGCLVQAMAPQGSHEVSISFRRDTHFGPMVLFSLNGVFRDTFNDISCRLAPLSLCDAHDIIREIKFFPMLASKSAPKFTSIEDLLLIMSELAMDFPEVEEAECDPVFVNEQGAFVGGIKVFLTPPKKHD